MGRVVISLAVLAATLGGAGIATAATATAPAHATIVDGASVRMNWSTAMPSVRGGSNGAVFIGSSPTMMMGAMMIPGNARLTVRREDGGGALLTAPTSFEVVRTQGENALIVRTAANAEVRITNDGAIVGGAVLGASAVSIDVNGIMSPGAGFGAAGADGRGALVVVVQYN